MATSWLLFPGELGLAASATSSSICSWRHFSGALEHFGQGDRQRPADGVSGTYSWHTISADYLSIWPLLLFPEALLNGMTMTLLAVYRPTGSTPSSTGSTWGAEPARGP